MKTLYLFRHGQTLWAKEGKHTGLTDISLTEKGVKDAKSLASRIQGLNFSKVYSSPLKRAFHTCELAGLSSKAVISPLLLEWNYGKYEGMTTAEILKSDPNWNVFACGGLDGESVQDIEIRTKAFLKEIDLLEGDIAIFSSGHFLRALASQWVTGNISLGKHLTLEPASMSILSYEHDYPVISKWNDTSHLDS